MGTWGTSNWDNDDALDTYDGVVDDIAARIDRGLSKDDVYFEDVGGEIALVEVLAVLGERCRNLFVPRVTVENWRRRVLAAYDEGIDSLMTTADPDFKAERRRVLEVTFDRLLAVLFDDEEDA